MVFPIVGGDGKPTGYEIDNSYRIDSGSAVGLSRFGNNSRNGDTFTISFWVKRAKLGTYQILVTSKVEDSGSNSFIMTFEDTDKIKIQGQPQAGTTGAGSNRVVILTTAVYRDPSAWYHIVYRHDTTQGTAGNRHRLYVNGVQQATDTNNALDQNTEFLYFYNASSFPYAIGNDERDNLYGDYYMAEHHYTDGVSNGPDAFGETNDNGVWIPKQYTGSHGTYGHYLKFEQSGAGSGTTAVGGHDYTTGSSSTIGADSSGNDNHFHVEGYSAEDNTVDTPTNNFCTLNPLHNFQNDPTYSEGNTKAVFANGGNGSSPLSTFAVNSGKWYWEAKFVQTSDPGHGAIAVGIVDADKYNVNSQADEFFDRYDYGFSYNTDGKKKSNNSAANFGDEFNNGDIIGVAVDFDNRQIYFSKNGTFQDSGDPTSGGTGTGSAFNFAAGTYYFAVYAYQDENSWEMNFGNAPFSISSGNSDGAGHGNFEYAVPSGYLALCTKNLASTGG